MRATSGRSTLLLWAYRAALIAAVWGLIAGLNIIYVDLLESRSLRIPEGLALALASVVLGVAVVLARRLRRRNLELHRRIDRLEQAVSDLTRCWLDAVQALAFPASAGQTQAAAIPSETRADAPQPAAPDLPEHATAPGAAAQPAVTAAAAESGSPDPTGLAADSRPAANARTAADARPAVREIPKPLQRILRRQLLMALHREAWAQVIEISREIEEAFAGSAVAAEAAAVRARAADKLAGASAAANGHASPAGKGNGASRERPEGRSRRRETIDAAPHST